MQIKHQVVTRTPLGGFTLVEVLASVALISIVAAYFVHIQIQQVQERVVEALAQDVLTLANASMTYFSQTNEWPDQENGDCDDLIATLGGLGAFPVAVGGYQGPDGITLATRCEDTGDLGRTLLISVNFPFGADDQAQMLMSYLPTSVNEDVDDDEGPVVTHYVATPRRASERYRFYRIALEERGIFRLSKPDCPGRRNDPAHILLPQAICMPASAQGLGGYFFDEIDDDDDYWELQLLVADGEENNNVSDFMEFSGIPTCDGNRVYVGAITYCETR
ncbi:MAG: hypothetical protein CMK83_06000 [Pseudomonadales bacterium]|jgi:prepilin-type N-terminal cleavage/methylation domain-containing protein|uniref:type II secretion system protein n=1 Tax=unclassified Ketobacter TaxID=2639109 RepID=UPI000C5E5E87|nr:MULTISPECIES: type II secretion system protein [unclassified Ketobacter]MAA59398.1 hypothetical protein [Pseudomonadales bacterium]MEC8810272.1 type II secretion system protein [Pseudomonadota bacterium]HAG95499.1 hypothetical protein [Gammaproteobacteria bacterium]MAQ23752.1 hypothetical protein [Pseudomonadales bacterium]MBI26263.1 hypothetical protein [Pseudomonadales bacterium]|tara:strand:- start:3234 stop:4064 length:831 start_codon:yes stop_codon:yes gene_type:complete